VEIVLPIFYLDAMPFVSLSSPAHHKVISWDLVGGSDVVAERKIGVRQSTYPEEAAIGIPSDQIVEPATHFRTLGTL